MTRHSSIELLLDTRAAAEIWIELHRTIREQKTRDANTVDGFEKDPLSESERDLYDALTQRFIGGLDQ
jgi:hypothetical protein